MSRQSRTSPAGRSLHQEGQTRPVRLFTLGMLLATTLLALFSLARVQGSGPGGTTFLPLLRHEPVPRSLTLRPVINGIGEDTVTVITHAGDQRLFVATQKGMIHVIQRDPVSGQFTTMSTFLDLRSEVAYSFEEGLLGLAFDPDYAENDHFYVTYTEVESGRIILARYEVSNDPNVADPDSRYIMLNINKPPNPPGNVPTYSPVHNAGDLHFGPDGYLYMATGDGGPDPIVLPFVPGDPYNHGQRLNTLLGKILRLDVSEESGLPPDCLGNGYTIPADNPFANGSGAPCDEIWSRGWRNPWRFSFDPLTGDMLAVDVGEWEMEELNVEPAGAGGRNYGWHCFEGTYDHRGAAGLEEQCKEPLEDYTFPVFTWDRTQGCSGIGGFVYRAELQQVLRGYYLFADFCSRKIWAIETSNYAAGAIELAVALDAPWNKPGWTAFGRDVNGELYTGGFLHDVVYQITVP